MDHQDQAILRPTVSRPVRFDVLPLLEQVTRCYISLTDNYFFPCRAPSLTRGQICNLQCNDASSISSYITTDGQSPARLGVLPLLVQVTRCYISLSDNYFFPCRAPSLTRGRICNFHCNDASSISIYIATDGLSVSSSWCRTPNGAHDQILIYLFNCYILSSRCRAPSPISPHERGDPARSQ
jgi:hypothetical protein